MRRSSPPAATSGAGFTSRRLDVSALLLHRSEHSSIQGVPGTQPLTNDELVALECDV